MKLIFRYVRKYGRLFLLTIFIKLLGTMAELALPYILEHIIDNVVPTGRMPMVIAWGRAMFAAAGVTVTTRSTARRTSGSRSATPRTKPRSKISPMAASLPG